jgi:hypothetical protein
VAAGRAANCAQADGSQFWRKQLVADSTKPKRKKLTTKQCAEFVRVSVSMAFDARIVVKRARHHTFATRSLSHRWLRLSVETDRAGCDVRGLRKGNKPQGPMSNARRLAPPSLPRSAGDPSRTKGCRAQEVGWPIDIDGAGGNRCSLEAMKPDSRLLVWAFIAAVLAAAILAATLRMT